MTDTNTGATGATSTTPPAKTDPPAGTTPPPAGSTTANEPEGLGEAGLKALRAERSAREAAERRAAAVEAERDELKTRTQTDAEKALDAARKEGASAAMLEANRKIAKSEARAAAGGKVVDVDDAVALLGDLDRFIVKGEVDGKAIASAIDELVKAKPYMAAQAAGRARPLPGGGATQSTGFSLNDDIRARAGRG